MWNRISKASHNIHITPEWERVINQIKDGERVMVIGGVDAGKTSFCLALEREIIKRKSKRKDGNREKIAVIDLDPGQQSISLPGCVGVRIKEISSGYRNFREKTFAFFVGSTSPRSSFHLITYALELFIKKIEREKPKITILDTSGYIQEDEAVLFKLIKAKIFRPTKIIFISPDENRKIESILGREFEIIKIKPSYLSKSISPEKRAEIRAKKISLYFSKTETIEIQKDEKILELGRKGIERRKEDEKSEKEKNKIENKEISESEKNSDIIGNWKIIEPGKLLDIVAFFKGEFLKFLGLVISENEGRMQVVVPKSSARKKWDFAIRKTIRI